MMKLLAELKRRQMFRVAAAYAVVAWVILQVVNNVAPVLDLPAWVARAFLLALVIGFPIALLFVWMRDLAPADGAAPKLATTKLDYVLAGGLILVIALLSYQQLAPTNDAVRSDAPVAAAGAPVTGGISIAVLPFVNLSDDRAQEFFSDGMTEEITSALAKVAGLKVVGRTSAFAFKGQNQDLRSIGQALSATHLIEGSVRRDGNEVRITAQLIKADDGTHLWTESYNRELKGVFALQEDIATAIASELRVPLGLREGQSLVSNRTEDTESYQDYLRARGLVRTRGALEPGGPLTEAVKLLEQVVARDPDYAPAWGLLGQAHTLIPIFTTAVVNGATNELRVVATESTQKAEAAAEQAIRLAPDKVDGYIALGLAKESRGGFAQAEDLYKQALSLDPGNPDALHRYSSTLANVGRLKDALALRLRLREQEPFVPVYNFLTARVLWETGRNDEAVALLKGTPPSYFTRISLAEVYASLGRYTEAAGALREIPSGLFPPEAIDQAAAVLRSAGQGASPQNIPNGTVLGFVSLYAAIPDRVLDYYENLIEAGYPVSGNNPNFFWGPAYAPVRKTDRFKRVARAYGLVNYWRARGWADLCRPVGADDFECD